MFTNKCNVYIQYKILNKNNQTYSNSIQLKISWAKKKAPMKKHCKIKSFKAIYLATKLQIPFLI